MPQAYMHHIRFLPTREKQGAQAELALLTRLHPPLTMVIGHQTLNRLSSQTYREGSLTFPGRFNLNPSEAGQEAKISLLRATHHGD